MKHIQILARADWDICTPTELRTVMRLDEGESDDVMRHYIDVATSLFESLTYYIIQKKHYQISYETADKKEYRISHRPFQGLLSVYRGERLLTPDQYSLKENILHLDDYSDYPLTVEYEAGFDNAEDMPISLKHILMMCAADLYLYRLTESQDYGFTDRIMTMIQLYAEKSL